MGNIASSGSKILFLALFAVFSALPAFALPKERTAVADAVVGLVELSKPSSDKWKKVKTGAKITHRDQVRTSAGARIDVRLPDGSTLSIDENSVVDFKELLEEDGNTKSNVRVDKGTVFFSIKKLTTAQSEFKFETRTATAAIRGTGGYVQASDVHPYQYGHGNVAERAETVMNIDEPQKAGGLDVKQASLKASGNEMPSEAPTEKMQEAPVPPTAPAPPAAGAQAQADAVRGEGAPAVADNTRAPGIIDTAGVNLKGRSAFYLSDGLASVETEKGESTTIAPNQLVTSGPDGASAYQVPQGADVRDLAKKTANRKLPKLQRIPLTGAAAVLSPAAGSLVEKTFRMSGKCTVADSLAKLTVGGKKVKVVDGAWSVELTAPEGEGNAFEVPVTLKAGNRSWSFKWSLKRAKAQPKNQGAALEIWGEQPFRPKDGVIEIGGHAACPVSAVLFSVGNSVSAATLRYDRDDRDTASAETACSGASFSARMLVSDVKQNWNETEGLVTLKSGENASQTAKVSIAVDRSDPAVNTTAPAVTLKWTNGGGKLSATVARNVQDTVEATLFVDGSERSRATVAGNGQVLFDAQTGVHDYLVRAVDLAGNAAEQRADAVEWWPLTNVKVELEIASGNGQSRVPPLPPNMERNRMETLKLRLLGLPENDPRSVKKITVTSSAGEVRELTGSEIYDVMLDVEVPVRSNGATQIKAKVVPKNGLAVERTIKVVPGK